METAQTRPPVPIFRLLLVALAGAGLIAAIALLGLSGAVDLPIVGSGKASSVAKSESAAQPAGGAALAVAPAAAGRDSSTLAGHRYQLYLAEGVTFASDPARYQGEAPAPADHTNHRYFTDEAGAGTERGDETVPKNHRIGQRTD